MKLSSRRLLVLALAAGFASTTAQTSQAGPWLDSLLGRRPPAYPVGAPVPVSGQTAFAPGAGYVPPSYAPYAGSQLGYVNAPYVANMPAAGFPTAGYYPSNFYASNQALGYGNYGAPVATTAPLLAPGFPQTIAGALPTAAYDSTWARTPVTYYRPVTAYDPRYGTTVTSLQPCTSYQYQVQRSPVIAPRPMLGEYGLQANKWPSITGPGYNPTGLAVTPSYPIVSNYQSVPNAGFNYSQPNTFAPLASSGGSSGMPTSTLPATTMPYSGGAVSSLPTYATSNYAPNTFYNGTSQALGYSGAVPAVGYSSPAVGSGVVPTASWMPSNANCANGTCSPNASSVPAPYVPGATVTPVGPPFYSTTPNGAPAPAQPGNPTYNPVMPNNASPVMPSQPVLPGADPESTVRPFLGSNSALTPKNDSVQSQRLPLVPVDQQANMLSKVTGSPAPQSPSLNTLLQPQPSTGSGLANSNLSSNINPSIPIPSTLPSNNESYRIKPLYAPEDFDTKAKWNPTLLEPDDLTAMERAGKLDDRVDNRNQRIRIQDEDSAVVTASAQIPMKADRNVIRLVSDSEKATKDSNLIRQPAFRPVSAPK